MYRIFRVCKRVNFTIPNCYLINLINFSYQTRNEIQMRTQLQCRSICIYNNTYRIKGNIRPRFIFAPFALVVSGQI